MPRRTTHVLPAALVAASLALGAWSVAADRGSAGGASRAWLGYVRNGDVFAFDPASSRTRRLTHGRVARWLDDLPAGDLAVSPDETKIAYTVSLPPRSGSLRLARTILVQPIGGGRSVEATPWNSADFTGRRASALRRHIDPHWLDSGRLEYTDDLDTNSHPWGLVMTVDLADGSHSRLSHLPSGALPMVHEPFVFGHGYSAFQVLDSHVSSGECSRTTDVVRGRGKRAKHWTATPAKDEVPLDINAAGDVLALREWVSFGRHDSLCTYGGPNKLTYELVVLEANGHEAVLKRFPTVRLRPGRFMRNIDAAWSPDEKAIAYTSPGGDLVILDLLDRSRRLVARDVQALDW